MDLFSISGELAGRQETHNCSQKKLVVCVSDNTGPLKSQKHVISLHSWAPALCFCLLLSLCLFKPERGVLSVQPQLPAPRGSISRLHLFEGFLIWGLGQAKSTVPSSIIPAEEQRRGEEGVERRKRTGGDAVISYLSSLSPTCPIAATASIFAISHSPTHSALPPPISFASLFLHLSRLLISALLLTSPAF